MMKTAWSQILVFGLSASEFMRVKFWSSLDQNFSSMLNLSEFFPKFDLGKNLTTSLTKL